MSEPERSSHRDDEGAEFDRRFSEIVADFERAPEDPDPEPTSELGSEGSEIAPQLPDQPSPSSRQDSSSRDHDVLGDGEAVAGRRETESWRGYDGEAEDEHFVPAPTDPLPAGDLHFWGIVLGLTIGPLLIFLSTVLSAVPTTPWGMLGLAATILGFVLLVLRSPRQRSGEDGSGARV